VARQAGAWSLGAHGHWSKGALRGPFNAILAYRSLALLPAVTGRLLAAAPGGQRALTGLEPASSPMSPRISSICSRAERRSSAISSAISSGSARLSASSRLSSLSQKRSSEHLSAGPRSGVRRTCRAEVRVAEYGGKGRDLEPATAALECESCIAIRDSWLHLTRTGRTTHES